MAKGDQRILRRFPFGGIGGDSHSAPIESPGAFAQGASFHQRHRSCFLPSAEDGEKYSEVSIEQDVTAMVGDLSSGCGKTFSESERPPLHTGGDKEYRMGTTEKRNEEGGLK